MLFAWCRYHPGLSVQADKLDKSKLPEDSFYHLFEMNLDGTGLRQLTHGKYNDFDGRYLPDGRIVFCSTRRGQATQYTRTAAAATHAYLHGEKVAFGLLAQLVLEGQPRSVLNRVLGFATEVGLPITLADIGLADLPQEQLHTIAVRATAEGETIHNEPFDVRPDMVADAIRGADAVGRAWKKGCSPE